MDSAINAVVNVCCKNFTSESRYVKQNNILYPGQRVFGFFIISAILHLVIYIELRRIKLRDPNTGVSNSMTQFDMSSIL